MKVQSSVMPVIKGEAKFRRRHVVDRSMPGQERRRRRGE